MGLFKQFKELWDGVDAPLPPSPVPETQTETQPEPLRADIKRSYAPEPLTAQDRRDLAITRSMPGYDVIRKVMEQQCEEAVTKHLNTSPDNEKEIISTFYMAKAAWVFFVKVQKQIEFEATESFTDQQGY